MGGFDAGAVRAHEWQVLISVGGGGFQRQVQAGAGRKRGKNRVSDRIETERKGEFGQISGLPGVVTRTKWGRK